jgi:hypothetical protein
MDCFRCLDGLRNNRPHQRCNIELLTNENDIMTSRTLCIPEDYQGNNAMCLRVTTWCLRTSADLVSRLADPTGNVIPRDPITDG